MADSPITLFIVDDEPVARMIAQVELGDQDYRVLEFETGEACLAALDERPDIVLLDIELPGMDGIAVCGALRERLGDAAQVIFISSHDDLETRLLAYDAGGDDYIVKPYDAAELARKVFVARAALASLHSLAEQADYARRAAFTAMSSMGEIGAVLDFLRASFTCRAPADLARALFAALGQYGLHGFAEMRLDDRNEYHACGARPCTALETSILGHASKTDRLFQFHDRMAVNYPRITLLITDLPLDDPERLGRYRDHLAIIAEGADSRLDAMAMESARLAQAGTIVATVAELSGMLADVEKMHGAHRLRMLQLASEYTEELNAAFIHLGLSESQEADVLTMAQRAYDRIGTALDDEKGLGERLAHITQTLTRLVFKDAE
jgi:CheY-like chemotaxis protein